MLPMTWGRERPRAASHARPSPSYVFRRRCTWTCSTAARCQYGPSLFFMCLISPAGSRCLERSLHEIRCPFSKVAPALSARAVWCLLGCRPIEGRWMDRSSAGSWGNSCKANPSSFAADVVNLYTESPKWAMQRGGGKALTHERKRQGVSPFVIGAFAVDRHT